MAEVDFSHARIAPATIVAGLALVNPTNNSYLGFTAYRGKLHNFSGIEISSGTMRTLIDNQKQFVFLFQGTFTANGTEAYIIGSDVAWKISNISFSSGDTYIFQIKADLICQ